MRIICERGIYPYTLHKNVRVGCRSCGTRRRQTRIERLGWDGIGRPGAFMIHHRRKYTHTCPARITALLRMQLAAGWTGPDRAHNYTSIRARRLPIMISAIYLDSPLLRIDRIRAIPILRLYDCILARLETKKKPIGAALMSNASYPSTHPEMARAHSGDS